MGSRYEKHPIVIEQKVQAGGEITINLVLTLKFDGTGMSVSPSVGSVEKNEIKNYDIDDDISQIIPKIKNEGIIKFGEKVD